MKKDLCDTKFDRKELPLDLGDLSCHELKSDTIYLHSNII